MLALAVFSSNGPAVVLLGEEDWHAVPRKHVRGVCIGLRSVQYL